MPSILRRCEKCHGRFAPQYFSFHSEMCRMCLMAEKIVECQAENREFKEKVKVFEECCIDYLELKERVKVL